MAGRFATAYVFRFENMRNATLKELRDKLHGSARCALGCASCERRTAAASVGSACSSPSWWCFDATPPRSFFLGSNKVLSVALGRSVEEERRPQLHRLSQRLRGDAGLVFTNLSRAQLEQELAAAAVAHHARAGALAEETVTLDAGPLLYRSALPFPHTMEPALRAAGVPSRLREGRVELLGAHEVCREGKALSAHAATVLKMLDLKLATFTMVLDSVWLNGEFEVLSEPESVPEEAEDADADEVAAMIGDDGGDFTFTEVEVASDEERAVKAKGARKDKSGKQAPGSAPAGARPRRGRQ